MGFIKSGEFREGREKENFFKLEDDGDIKLVRILCKNIESVPVVTYHIKEVDGYSRKVSCLRDSYDDPISKCPLCKSNDRSTARKYLQLLVYETDKNGVPVEGKEPELQIWDRGKRFVDKIKSIQARLERKGKALCDVLFDIERIGKKNSTDTTYELYERTDLEADKYSFELPEEFYNPIGKSIFDYTFEELTNILEGKPLEDEGVEKRGEEKEPEQTYERKEETNEYRRGTRRL